MESSRKLKIVVVGSAMSSHVRQRSQCFADLGHKVWLLTESLFGCENVREIGPTGRILAIQIRILVTCFMAPIVLWLLRPDVVHVHYAYNPVAWIVGVFCNCPIVVSTMGADILFDEQGRPTQRGRWLTLNLLNRAEIVTAKSDYLAEILRSLGVAREKIHRIVWGVDTAIFRPQEKVLKRQALQIFTDQVVLFSPKPVTPFYKIDRIIEAVSILVHKGVDAIALIGESALDECYKRAMVDLARRLEILDRIRFCGLIDYSKMPDYYGAADFVVTVPPSDGVPQSLFEGMACGRPLIMTNLERYREFVTHRESAMLIEPSSGSIVESVLELIHDPDLAEKLSRRGLEDVRRFASLDIEVMKVERIYRGLVDGSLPVSPRTYGANAAGKIWTLTQVAMFIIENAVRFAVKRLGLWVSGAAV